LCVIGVSVACCMTERTPVGMIVVEHIGGSNSRSLSSRFFRQVTRTRAGGLDCCRV
jgi:hypothetical protein